MRLTLALPLVLLAPPAAPPGLWEKSVAAGVTYRSENQPGGKVVYHAVRVDPRAPGLRMVPELANGTVYEAVPGKPDPDGRETVGAAARRLGAVAVINADFFPFGKAPAGDPLGVMVRGGELLSTPVRPRAVFAWGPKGSSVIVPSFSGTASWAGSEPVPLDGVNEQAPSNGASVSAAVTGFAVGEVGATFAVMRPRDEGRISPSGTMELVVESVIAAAPFRQMPIPPGRIVLVGRGKRAAAVARLASGVAVTLRWSLVGFDPTLYTDAIGGGPVLLQGGRVAIDAKAEDFPESFSDKKHPRSAIGRTADGYVWLVEVDGRTEDAGGMSLTELAAKMRELGCIDAINLDGGGSSALAVRGVTVNRPSDGSERAVANFVAVYADRPETKAASPLAIEATPTGADLAQLRLKAGGKIVPNAEVVWGATGGWSIDQGGLARKIAPGEGRIRGDYAGVQVSLALP